MTAAKRTRYPSIPRRSGQSQEVVALAEVAEILTGQRGDGLDRALTLRDASELGIISLLRPGGGGRYVPGPGTGPGGGGGGPITTAQPPHTPLNVIASGAFTAIYVAWDRPTYAGHAYAEIWRSSVDDFGTAVRIGTEAGTLFADPIGPGADRYYWVRFVNVNGQVGPLHGTAGVRGQTAPNISEIMDELGDRLGASHLNTTLNDRINLVDAPATGLIDRLAAEINARQQADANLQVQIESIVLSNIADVYYQPDMPTGEVAENSRWFDTDDGNKPYLYKNGAWVDTSDQRILDVVAAVATEQSARIAADLAQAERITAIETSLLDPATGLGATASAVNALSSTVASQGSQITANAQQITQIQAIVGVDYAALQQISDVTIGPEGIIAEYFLRTDVNGHIAGYGLMNDGATSQFIINASTFGISHPGAPNRFPFIVDAGQIYMDTALIKDGSIQNAKIQNLSADKINAGFLSVARIEANSITADRIDSRGLTIQDEFGNILLGAGNLLDYSLVGGVKPPSNATFGANSATLFAGRGSNLLQNPAFRQNSDLWSFGSGSPNIIGGRNSGADWTLAGEGTLYIYQAGAELADSYWGAFGQMMPVVAGTRLEAHAYTGAHRCQVQVTVAFSTAAGAYITETVVGVNNQEALGGPSLASYKKTGGFVVVPAGAARATFFVRKSPTVAGQANSYAFISRAFMSEAGPNQTELSPWGDSGPSGAFAFINQLTAQNISTYIAAAAIGTAHIGTAAITNALIANLAVGTAKIADLAVTTGKIQDLAVNTLKIGPNSVSVPVGAYTAAAMIANAAETQVQSVFVSNPSPNSVTPVNVTAACSFDSGGVVYAIMVLRRNGAEVARGYAPFAYDSNFEWYYGSGSLVFMDFLPPGGGYTYTLHITRGRADATLNTRNRSLTAMSLAK